MQYSKKIEINRKIIKENDVLRIAKLVHEQAKTDVFQEEYTIVFSDNSKIISKSDLSVFDSEEFHYRKAQEVTITYNSKNLKNRITVELCDSLLWSLPSSVEIASEDRDWYNSICNQVTTIVNEIQRQPFNISETAGCICSLFLGPFEGMLLVDSIIKFFPSLKSVATGLSGISSMILCFVNLYFINRLRDGYPNIEFAFGPDFLNQSKKIRKCAGVAIPFLIDIVLFVLGLFQ